MSERIDVLAVMEACSAYVDDAAQFPEQFKPGVVKRHQREYNEARAAVAELIEAAKEHTLFLGSALRLFRCDEDFIEAQSERLNSAIVRAGGVK